MRTRQYANRFPLFARFRRSSFLISVLRNLHPQKILQFFNSPDYIFNVFQLEATIQCVVIEHLNKEHLINTALTYVQINANLLTTIANSFTFNDT